MFLLGIIYWSTLKSIKSFLKCTKEGILWTVSMFLMRPQGFSYCCTPGPQTFDKEGIDPLSVGENDGRLLVYLDQNRSLYLWYGFVGTSHPHCDLSVYLCLLRLRLLREVWLRLSPLWLRFRTLELEFESLVVSHWT